MDNITLKVKKIAVPGEYLREFLCYSTLKSCVESSQRLLLDLGFFGRISSRLKRTFKQRRMEENILLCTWQRRTFVLLTCTIK